MWPRWRAISLGPAVLVGLALLAAGTRTASAQACPCPGQPGTNYRSEGRGTIGAFSPSGLSLDGPAHRFHKALMAEIVSGEHERLGDAVLAAYADTGVMPELLAVYHLFGDPGMEIR